MEFQGYYETPQQDYFQQLEYPYSQNYPHFSESDDMEEPAPEEVAAAATYRPPRSSYGTRPTSGPAKTTAPPMPKSRSPPPPEFRPSPPTQAPTLRGCRQHGDVDCDKCLLPRTPTHHCQALIAICQHCSFQSLQMPVNPTARIPICRSRWPTQETTCPSPTGHRVFHRRRLQVTHSCRKSYWPGRAMHPDRWDRTPDSGCPDLH